MNISESRGEDKTRREARAKRRWILWSASCQLTLGGSFSSFLYSWKSPFVSFLSFALHTEYFTLPYNGSPSWLEPSNLWRVGNERRIKSEVRGKLSDFLLFN